MRLFSGIRCGVLPPVVLAVLLVICACGAATPELVEVTKEIPITVVVEVTQEVPVTVVVTQLVEVIVTPTPIPATPTPEATATPVFQVWASPQAANAFSAAGLESVDVRPITKDDYGMAPMTAVEGSRFLVPSLCADCGGRIFSFASQQDLEAIEAYYVELGRSSSLFFSWVFVKDNILVQINGDLDEGLARQYEAALDAME